MNLISIVKGISIKRLMWAGIFVLGIPQSVFAQSVNEPPPEFRIRFRAMGWSETASDLFFIQDREKIAFTATMANPSKWVEYRGPIPLLIYKEGEYLPEPGPDGETIPRPVGTLKFTNSGDWLLMFLETSDPEGRLVYRTFPLADTPDLIEEGFRIINFTDEEIAFQVNESLTRLEPYAVKHISPNAREDFSLSVLIASRREDEWKIRYENLFRDRPGIRTTLFIAKKDENIRIRRFLDRVSSGK